MDQFPSARPTSPSPSALQGLQTADVDSRLLLHTLLAFGVLLTLSGALDLLT